MLDDGRAGVCPVSCLLGCLGKLLGVRACFLPHRCAAGLLPLEPKFGRLLQPLQIGADGANSLVRRILERGDSELQASWIFLCYLNAMRV